MSPFTLIRQIISPLLFLNIVNRYKGRSALIKIKAAQGYVTGVKKTRILFLGIIFVVFSFVLLGSGLFLIHTALFTYSSWSAQGKFVAALILGIIEFAVAMFILAYLLREETWVKFFGVQKVLNSVAKDTSDDKKCEQGGLHDKSRGL